MIPREEILQYARMIAQENGLDPDAFVQALSAPLGPLAQYEQDGDADALLAAMETLAASGNIGGGASGEATQPRAAAEDPTAAAPAETGRRPIEYNAEEQGIAPQPPADDGGVPPLPSLPPQQEETDPFRNPSPDAVDPGMARAARQPQNIPTVAQAAPNTTPGMGGMPFMTGAEQMRAAPFGAIPPDQMNRYEQEYFFPFFSESLGGADQASRNLAMAMGFAPQSGNPWSRFMESVITPLAGQAEIAALLSDRVDPVTGSVDMGTIVPMVQEAMKAGRTTVFGEGGLPKALGDLKQLAVDASAGNFSSDPGKLMLQGRLTDPNSAMGIVESLMSSAASPYQRRQLRPALRERMGQYFRQAPSQPNVSPFEAMLSGLGY